MASVIQGCILSAASRVSVMLFELGVRMPGAQFLSVWYARVLIFRILVRQAFRF